MYEKLKTRVRVRARTNQSAVCVQVEAELSCSGPGPDGAERGMKAADKRRGTEEWERRLVRKTDRFCAGLFLGAKMNV